MKCYWRLLYRVPVLAAVMLGMMILGMMFAVGRWADDILDNWTKAR